MDQEGHLEELQQQLDDVREALQKLLPGSRAHQTLSKEMADLEAQPQVTAAPAPTPAPEPMMAPEAAAFTVLFDFDEAELSPDARTLLADVVMAAKKSDYQTIDIGGYTDLVGSEAYNQVLSEQRANAVINFLVESGIDAGKIIGQGYGKADPVVAVHAPEIRNRRVEIKLEP